MTSGIVSSHRPMTPNGPDAARRRANTPHISPAYSLRKDAGYKYSSARYMLTRHSHSAGGKPGGARHFHELAETPRFGRRDGGAVGGNPVVAPALVVVFRRRAIARLDNQSLFEHALDRAVERAGAQL